MRIQHGGCQQLKTGIFRANKKLIHFWKKFFLKIIQYNLLGKNDKSKGDIISSS